MFLARIARRAFAILPAAGLVAAALAHPHDPPLTPAAVARPGETAIVEFRVLDDAGNPIPARLTFVGPDGGEPDLFTQPDAAPNELAVRKNVAYTLRGFGAITAPPGKYRVYASRGLEWSIAHSDLALEAGKTASFQATLKHEVDTTGWISGDYHLHTLTYSGHGDANLKERVITFVGEGLEFAVATDHNHNTDYGPTVAELGVQGQLTHVTGNEVTTPIGHFNAFPLDPSRPIPPPDAHDARALFKIIRNETNRYGILPVVQVNHPRWGGIDYFGLKGLDPILGDSPEPTWSSDFDSVEVFNENAGWGYYDAEMPRVPVGDSKHWVLRDWFNLLNRGLRIAAVGNSDSHTVQDAYAGWPRNFTPSSTDDPGRIDPGQVAAAIRRQCVTTTLGPFVQFEVNGKPMGSDVTASAGGEVVLHIRVQAASWISCDRVSIVVNGDIVQTIAVPSSTRALRLDERRPLKLARDAWVALLVEGDQPLAPILHPAGRPILPLAVANPVFVDSDGDGLWTSPLEQARKLVRGAGGAATPGIDLRGLGPTERGLVIWSAAEANLAAGAALLAQGLKDADRPTRLFAAKAAARLGAPGLKEEIEAAYARAKDDPYLRVTLLAAATRLDPGRAAARVTAFVEEHGKALAQRYAGDLFEPLGGEDVRAWMAIGYFPGASYDDLARAHGPERDADGAHSHAGKSGPVAWKPARVRASGFVDLRSLGASRPEADRAIAFAQTWLWTDSACQPHYALGSDDGCRLWVNDALIYEDATDHAANRLQQFDRLPLQAGWNRVLIAVRNAGGEMGFYLRVFDSKVRASATRE